MANIANDVEVFILESGVDQKAADSLRCEKEAVQRLVVDRGSIAALNNLSSALIGRIREARAQANQMESSGGWGKGAAFGGKGASGKGKGALPSAEDVEAFIIDSGVDEKAAESLRNASPTVQQVIIVRGTVSTCANPSSALAGRLRDAIQAEKWSGGGYQPTQLSWGGVQLPATAGPAARPSAAGGVRPPAGGAKPCTPDEVELYIMESALDEDAAEFFREQPPMIQRLVVQRGALVDVPNPSSALMTRIREAKRGGGPSASPGVTIPTASAVGGSTEEVEAFILENGLDEKSSKALRDQPANIQARVLAKGSVANTRNPSAAIIGRVNEARRLDEFGYDPSGWGGAWAATASAAKGGKGGGCWGPTIVAPTSDELETFLVQNAVDEKASEALRKEAPGVQRMVMERGDLVKTSNPSSAIIGRIKQYRQEGYGNVACTGQDMLGEVEVFIATNGLDERAAKAIREEAPHIQSIVIQRGGCADTGNPSATVLGRIRDAQKGGGFKGKGWDPWSMAAAKGAWDWGMYGGKGGCGGGGKGKGKGSGEVEAFIAFNGLDEGASKSLREAAPYIQAAVVARGAVNTCKNPSSAIIGRIAELLRGGGGGGGGGGASEPSAKRQRKGGESMDALDQLINGVFDMQEPLVQSGDPAVESFIAMNRIDAKAAEMLRKEAPDFQQVIMDRGSLLECSNPSAVLIARIRDTKKKGASGGKGGAAAAAQRWV